MQDLEIIWLESALDDLEEIRGYYIENVSIDTYEKLLQRIINSVGHLSKHAYLGKPSARNKGLRELSVPNSYYTVPYRVKDNQIEILRVFDGRQKPLESWML
jgi:toxin ParE1/3/4